VKGVCRSENKDRGRTQKKNKQKGRGQLQILGAERKKKKKKRGLAGYKEEGERRGKKASFCPVCLAARLFWG
jgi:hypothetical protein